MYLENSIDRMQERVHESHIFWVTAGWKCLSSCDNVAGYGVLGLQSPHSYTRWDLRGVWFWLLLQPYLSLLATILNISLNIWVNLSLTLICFMSDVIYSDGSAGLASFKLLILSYDSVVVISLHVFPILSQFSRATTVPFHVMCRCSSHVFVGQ